MNRTRRPLTYLLLVSFVGTLAWSTCGTATAQTKFLSWFRDRIGERTAKDEKQAELDAKWQKEHFADDEAGKRFVAAFKKARCYTCHVRGEKREVRNEFGKVLSESLRAELEMDTKAITAALKSSAPEELQLKVQTAFYKCLDEALKAHVKPEDENSGTYADRVKRGELPAAE